MKKIKKIIVLAMATTMLLGSTLTANAASINVITANGVKYTVNSSTTLCSNCHRNSAVLRKISPLGSYFILSWNCMYCYYAFGTTV